METFLYDMYRDNIHCNIVSKLIWITSIRHHMKYYSQNTNFLSKNLHGDNFRPWLFNGIFHISNHVLLKKYLYGRYIFKFSLRKIFNHPIWRSNEIFVPHLVNACFKIGIVKLCLIGLFINNFVISNLSILKKCLYWIEKKNPF